MKTKINLLILFGALTVSVAAQTGGAFEITQSAVANGGGQSAGGNFSLVGTAGQQTAGGTLDSVQFHLYSGFWSPDLVPTAANVTVSGRVLNFSGRGVFRAQIIMTDAGGAIHYASTNPFGYFRFERVEAGQTYVFSVTHKRYLFTNNPQVLFVSQATDELMFIAAP